MNFLKMLLRNLLILAVILVIASPWWLRAVPSKYFSALVGKSSIVDKLVCNFSTKVSGQSMMPLLMPEATVGLNRCFKENDLTKGRLILFSDSSSLRFGIIRFVLPLNPVVYKVSSEKSPEIFQSVIKEEIAGIGQVIGDDETKFQAREKAESFILDPNEYLTDFYLAKIPKNAGLETAAVVKADLFSRKEDKFCFAVSPKKNLTAVDIEIVNKNKQNTVTLGNNIVFNVSEKPNINCMDFGRGAGMLNLDQGRYQFRFLMNHQVLEDIPFAVN